MGRMVVSHVREVGGDGQRRQSRARVAIVPATRALNNWGEGAGGTVKRTEPIPMAERSGGIDGESWVWCFLGLRRRGGRRRLKLATTSGGECRLSVGCAFFFAKSDFAKSKRPKKNRLTPGARVRIVYRGIGIARVYFSHKAIDLDMVLTEKESREDKVHLVAGRGS
jgi:hypothetical protein